MFTPIRQSKCCGRMAGGGGAQFYIRAMGTQLVSTRVLPAALVLKHVTLCLATDVMVLTSWNRMIE
jgi:hypothetical protein